MTLEFVAQTVSLGSVLHSSTILTKKKVSVVLGFGVAVAHFCVWSVNFEVS